MHLPVLIQIHLHQETSRLKIQVRKAASGETSTTSSPAIIGDGKLEGMKTEEFAVHDNFIFSRKCI